jgi:hypothetical protein
VQLGGMWIKSKPTSKFAKVKFLFINRLQKVNMLSNARKLLSIQPEIGQVNFQGLSNNT